MAIRKYRLVQEQLDGSQDTIYLETDSNIVTRPDGTSVEDALTGLKSDIQTIELTPGPQGPKGDTGATGPAGPGIAAGGTTDQALVKTSNSNYATGWKSLSLGLTLVASGSNTVIASTNECYTQATGTFVEGMLYLIYCEVNGVVMYSIFPFHANTGVPSCFGYPDHNTTNHITVDVTCSNATTVIVRARQIKIVSPLTVSTKIYAFTI